MTCQRGRESRDAQRRDEEVGEPETVHLVAVVLAYCKHPASCVGAHDKYGDRRGDPACELGASAEEGDGKHAYEARKKARPSTTGHLGNRGCDDQAGTDEGRDCTYATPPRRHGRILSGIRSGFIPEL